MIDYIANNSRVNEMFQIKNIDYTFYKNESIKKIYQEVKKINSDYNK